LPLAGAALPLAGGAVFAAPPFLASERTAKDLLFLLIMTLKRSKSLRLARFAFCAIFYAGRESANFFVRPYASHAFLIVPDLAPRNMGSLCLTKVSLRMG